MFYLGFDNPTAGYFRKNNSFNKTKKGKKSNIKATNVDTQ